MKNMQFMSHPALGELLNEEDEKVCQKMSPHAWLIWQFLFYLINRKSYKPSWYLAHFILFFPFFCRFSSTWPPWTWRTRETWSRAILLPLWVYPQPIEQPLTHSRFSHGWCSSWSHHLADLLPEPLLRGHQAHKGLQLLRWWDDEHNGHQDKMEGGQGERPPCCGWLLDLVNAHYFLCGDGRV